jgi:hypothetical protein
MATIASSAGDRRLGFTGLVETAKLPCHPERSEGSARVCE